MSSTNRGTNPKDHNRHDYYVTPVPEIVRFLKEFQKAVPNIFQVGGVILDPCAGGDANHLMSYPEALKEFGASKIITVDIRQDSLAEIKTDYLTFSHNEKPDIIITNPPFYLAQQVIEKALQEVRPGGHVIMLLRLNYFGSNKRKPFWEKNMPKYVFVHHRRMSFTDDGKTDSIEYMHAVWKKGEHPDFTMLKVI